MKRQPMAPGSSAIARERQAAFFARTGDQEPIRALFNHLPNHRFFIKSVSGHFLAANNYNLRRLGLDQEAQIVGWTDEQAHPPTIAHVCRQDDLRIMGTLCPMINHVEMLFHDEQNRWEWGCTTKLAIMGDEGRVIGLMGISYPAVAPVGTVDEEAIVLEKVVFDIKERHSQPLKVDELARAVGLSPKRLNEIFQRVYRMTIQQFIIHTRVEAAVQTLLNTRMPLGEVALEHGFSDQSAFTRHFRRMIGQTPQQFRSLRSMRRGAEASPISSKKHRK